MFVINFIHYNYEIQQIKKFRKRNEVLFNFSNIITQTTIFQKLNLQKLNSNLFQSQ